MIILLLFPLGQASFNDEIGGPVGFVVATAVTSSSSQSTFVLLAASPLSFTISSSSQRESSLSNHSQLPISCLLRNSRLLTISYDYTR